MMAIGYKELYTVFDGLSTLDTAVSLIKQQTRRYAKRQLTWFKNQMNATWYTVDPMNFEATVQAVLNDL
jgi:tRNA dimethylallyltransferase